MSSATSPSPSNATTAFPQPDLPNPPSDDIDNLKKQIALLQHQLWIVDNDAKFAREELGILQEQARRTQEGYWSEVTMLQKELSATQQAYRKTCYETKMLRDWITFNMQASAGSLKEG